MTTQTEALKLADALNELLESFEKDGKFCKSSSIRNELYDRLKQTLEESKEVLSQQSNERVESVAVMELYTDGWDLVEGIDTDWLETLPFGTRLFSHPPVPWTSKQIKEYAQAQRAQMPKAPL